MPGATHRHTCEGLGLIDLRLETSGRDGELRWSHTNHNSAARAAAWAGTSARLGSAADWDFAAVTSASGKLNRAIRRMAVQKIRSHPILPGAAEFIARAGLRFEYGTGIHATPVAGYPHPTPVTPV